MKFSLYAKHFGAALGFFAITLSVSASEGHHHEHQGGKGESHADHGMPAGPLHIMKPWVRSTVPAQKATGAYMMLMAHADGKLVGAKSTIAEKTEVHEMSMDGDIMRMRRVDGIPMEEGDVVKLQPGGFHVMFMGLKQQVKEGDTVNFSLVFEGKDGALTEVPVQAKAMMKGGGGHDHDHDHGSHDHGEHKH